MKVSFVFVVGILLILSDVHGQHFCGFDGLHQLHRSSEEQCNIEILERTSILTDHTEEISTIPVVVHVIHNDGPENIDDGLIADAISYLSDAFSNNGLYQSELGVNTNIQFCLAAQNPLGEFSTGVERIESAFTDVLVPVQEAELKALSHWDGQQYLNIWVVKKITREEDNDAVVGFATFPSMHGEPIDGIVVEYTAMGASAPETSVLVHEVGHYLGLYHTFQGGCPNGDCLTSGDWVCDTPPDAAAFNTLCFDGTNSCTTDADDTSINNPYRPIDLDGLGDQLDMQTNFMDYANLLCFERFTEGQAIRMQAALFELRFSLLEGNRCSGPCDNPISVEVNSTSLAIEVGEAIEFTNFSANFESAEWFINGASQGVTEDFIFTPLQQGAYTVSVVMDGDQPGCTETVVFEAIVSCPVQASFEFSSPQFDAGDSLVIDNTSVGADSYMWYLDGELVSTDESPVLEFSETGAYTLQLLAISSTCSEWSTSLNLSVGSCASGNEANLWLFFNSFGTGFGLDFNTDPPTPVLENNLPSYVEHCKTTLCDEAGSPLFLSTGTEVLNSDFDVMPNGDQLLGNTSSHYGTMIVASPSSAHEYYVFHSSLPDDLSDGGLFYSVIDETLEDGYGDITVKNQFLGALGQEAITCVRHCNLIDFWLLTYDQIESRYLSWLVTESGVATDPIVSEIQQDVFHTLPLTPSAKGDQIMHGNLLMAFDASLGSLSVEVDFGLTNLVGWEFSGSGRYLYLLDGEFATTISQVDLWTINASEPLLDAVAVNELGTAVYFYPQRAPDGNIYIENALGGDIARIVAPNLPADQLVFEPEFENFQTLINSFGNYFHRYVHGESLFIEGDLVACAGSPLSYNVYGSGCLQGEVEWTVAGAAFSELSNGEISVEFPSSGIVTLTATMELACGLVTGTMEVEVLPNPGLELGQDFGLCSAETVYELDAGSGFGSYSWNTGENTQTIMVSEPGLYAVSVNAEGCTSTDEVEVFASESNPIDLGPDVILCLGEIIVLDAGIGYNDYTWQDGTTGPQYTVFEAGTYVVSSAVPCQAQDTLVVTGCGEGIGLEIGNATEAFIRAVPNPNHGSFTVNWDANIVMDQWTLYSISGQYIASGRPNGKGLASIVVEVVSGVYVIQLKGRAGSWFERIVID